MPEVETASETQVAKIETGLQGGVWVSQGLRGPPCVGGWNAPCPGEWPDFATSVASATCSFLT